MRFEQEMEEFKRQHPNWLASRRGNRKASRTLTRPRKPLTAFMAFLQEKLRDVASGEDVMVMAKVCISWDH